MKASGVCHHGLLGIMTSFDLFTPQAKLSEAFIVTNIERVLD